MNGLSGTYAINTTTKKVGTGSINFQTNASYSGLSITKSVIINSFTIAGWYYMNTGVSYPRFFCIRAGAIFIEIYLVNNSASLSQETSFASGTFSISGTFTFNTWNHMAFVYDNIGNTLKTYMNNSLISTNTFTFTSFTSSTISVGIDPNYPNTQYIIGYVDDFRMYSYALSASNIDTIYKLT